MNDLSLDETDAGLTRLTDSISAAMIDLYARNYGRGSTVASTYINDKVVVCILLNILTVQESTLVAHGGAKEVIDSRIAFQEDYEDEFTAEITRLTGCNVVAFLSANQAIPGVACELFFLDRAPAVAMSGVTSASA